MGMQAEAIRIIKISLYPGVFFFLRELVTDTSKHLVTHLFSLALLSGRLGAAADRARPHKRMLSGACSYEVIRSLLWCWDELRTSYPTVLPLCTPPLSLAWIVPN